MAGCVDCLRWRGRCWVNKMRRTSTWVGLVASIVIVAIGLANQLDWITIIIRTMIAFGLFYTGTQIIGFFGLQAILRRQIVKIENPPKRTADVKSKSTNS